VAKGGGGAWKVAYADFVTAMMAFFLVMWICSQDQKIKQAVARYFVTPMGLVETGISKKPNHAGAILPTLTAGSVPSSESVSLGRGRVPYSQPDNLASNATKAVGDWLQTSDELEAYWQEELHRARDHAWMTKEFLDKPGSLDDAVILQMSRRLREGVSRNVHSEQSELSHELLSQVLADVNWTELAEDLLLRQSRKPEPSSKASANQARR
jgi:flagellar motor protein MotB